MSTRFYGAKDRETPRAQHEQASAVLCDVPGVQGAGPLVPAKLRRAATTTAAGSDMIAPEREKGPGLPPEASRWPFRRAICEMRRKPCLPPA